MAGVAVQAVGAAEAATVHADAAAAQQALVAVAAFAAAVERAGGAVGALAAAGAAAGGGVEAVGVAPATAAELTVRTIERGAGAAVAESAPN